MNFSPISDCGWIVQSASLRNGANSLPTCIWMRALWSGVSLTSTTLPAFAPAIFTSWPGIRNDALSKIASTR